MEPHLSYRLNRWCYRCYLSICRRLPSRLCTLRLCYSDDRFLPKDFPRKQGANLKLDEDIRIHDLIFMIFDLFFF